MSEPGQLPVGAVALTGQEEYIRGHIFESANEQRWIEGRGTLIMTFHPSDPTKTKTYPDISEDTKFSVPPGHKVKVIDALVKMTR